MTASLEDEWRPRSPVFAGLEPTLNIAHRGGAGLYPENTLAAFVAAVSEHGCPMLETDVQLTADNEVVVFHDAALHRTTDGDGPIADWTLKALRGLDASARFVAADDVADPFRGHGLGIPTLREALRALPETRFNIEVKSPDPKLVDATVEVLREEGAVGRVVVGSEHDALAERLVHAYPEGSHFFPRDRLFAWVMAVVGGQPPPAPGPYSVIAMPAIYQGVPLVTPTLIAEARRAAVWLNVWTIDEEKDMRWLMDLGVGGIMTDRPDRLAALLRERRRSVQ